MGQTDGHRTVAQTGLLYIQLYNQLPIAGKSQKLYKKLSNRLETVQGTSIVDLDPNEYEFQSSPLQGLF